MAKNQSVTNQRQQWQRLELEIIKQKIFLTLKKAIAKARKIIKKFNSCSYRTYLAVINFLLLLFLFSTKSTLFLYHLSYNYL